jgi:hypothetical protein
MLEGKVRKDRSSYHLGEMVDGDMNHLFAKRYDAVLDVLVDGIGIRYMLVVVDLVARADVVILVLEKSTKHSMTTGWTPTVWIGSVLIGRYRLYSDFDIVRRHLLQTNSQKTTQPVLTRISLKNDEYELARKNSVGHVRPSSPSIIMSWSSQLLALASLRLEAVSMGSSS